MADHAAQVGADAVSSIPPFAGGYYWDEIHAFYAELARRSSLPRLWVPRGTAVSVGATLGAADGALAAAALVPVAAGAFPRSVRAVREGPDELTLVMQSGVEVRLGTIGDLRLKLAIAKRILALAGADAGSGTYVDVSVPERPVLGSANGSSTGSTNSQVATGA